MSFLSQHADCTAEGDFVVQLTYPILARFRYRSWEAGFGCERWDQGRWHDEDGDFGLPLLDAAQFLSIDDPLARFVQGIPAAVREQVAGYEYNQSLLLRWLARNRHARDLFDHSPQLCWLLICYGHEQQLPHVEIAALFTSPRVQILQAVTGINSKASVKALARVQLNKGTGQEYHVLRHFLLRRECLQPLMHWPQIPIQALWACRKYPLLLNGRSLKNYEFSASWSTAQLQRVMEGEYRYWRDALNVARLLDISDAQIALERCTHFTDVKILHDRWTDKVNQRSYLVSDGGTLFPTPPLAGNADIFPILSMEDLREEGRLMRHCVASYDRDVIAGKCYLYRMLRPERATIEVRTRKGKPELAQIALAYNQKPMATTRTAVQSWITTHHEQTPLPSNNALSA